MTTPKDLRALYAEGTNISAYLRDRKGSDQNDPETIEFAYDLQAGSYSSGMLDEAFAAHKTAYSAEIARVVKGLCHPSSILEVGVGEATTLSGVLEALGGDIPAFGFDLSWSRVACAMQWLEKRGVGGVSLCTGDLEHIPCANGSMDVVYTSHSIEPNGGREEPILAELLRVTGRYLILLEPAYELGSEAARDRMRQHGYCQGLAESAARLGGEVMEHRLFPYSDNPMNPTALTVVKVQNHSSGGTPGWACPRCKTPLERIGSCWYSPEALSVYPELAGIPCLRVDNAIVASKFPEFIQGVDLIG